MAGPKRIGIFYLILTALFISECKNHEKVSPPPSASKKDLNPCTELTQNYSDDTLLFVANAESDRKVVAAKKAENQTVIQLVQFFQDNFIEDGQLDLFRSSNREGNASINRSSIRSGDAAFFKEWSETSYKIIGRQHNQNTFTHHQKFAEDSTGYIAYDMLEVSQDWIRNHWKESLAATDSSFYQNVTEGTYYQEVMEMNIRQQPPCENF